MKGQTTLHSFTWQGTGLTDQGLVRTANQDCFAVDNTAGLWIVADGMGGHAGGSMASQLAVRAVTDYFIASSTSQALIQRTDAADRAHHIETLLAAAITSADSLVRTTAAHTPDLAGMGTTIVVGLFCPGAAPSVAIGHIGDSRAYLIRDRQIRPLTTDHSFVQRLVTEGRVSVDEAKRHPQQNILLRAIGVGEQVPPDVTTHTLSPSDVLLLCTDGLTKMVEEQEMLGLILEHNDRPAEACQPLIALANARGGKDNTTVILVSSH